MKDALLIITDFGASCYGTSVHMLLLIASSMCVPVIVLVPFFPKKNSFSLFFGGTTRIFTVRLMKTWKFLGFMPLEIAMACAYSHLFI